MSTLEIVLIVYLHGVVLWTALVFLALKKKTVKGHEIISLIIGALWFYFVPHEIIKMIFERKQKHAKNHTR
jgi:hypothetical protein